MSSAATLVNSLFFIKTKTVHCLFHIKEIFCYAWMRNISLNKKIDIHTYIHMYVHTNIYIMYNLGLCYPNWLPILSIVNCFCHCLFFQKQVPISLTRTVSPFLNRLTDPFRRKPAKARHCWRGQRWSFLSSIEAYPQTHKQQQKCQAGDDKGQRHSRERDPNPCRDLEKA